MVRARGVVAAALASMLLVPALSTPAEAAPIMAKAAYKNCTQLNKDYPSGVGKKGARDKTKGKPVTNFTVNTKLYNSLSKSLDRDKDGIACEKLTKAPAKKKAPVKKAPVKKAPVKKAVVKKSSYTVKGRTVVTTDENVGFASPSGNIVCGMWPDVRCEVIGYSYVPPKRPASCDMEWGQTVTLNRSAEFACVGDSVVSSANYGDGQNAWFTATKAKPVKVHGDNRAVLPYGWTLRRGAFSCTSAKSGVTCTNLNTKHGFTLSKSAYKLF